MRKMSAEWYDKLVSKALQKASNANGCRQAMHSIPISGQHVAVMLDFQAFFCQNLNLLIASEAVIGLQELSCLAADLEGTQL